MLTVAERTPEFRHWLRMGAQSLGESLMFRGRKARHVEQLGERGVAEYERLAKHVGGAQHLHLSYMPGNLSCESGANTVEGNGGCLCLRLAVWRQTENRGNNRVDQGA